MYSIHCYVNFLSPKSSWSPCQTSPEDIVQWIKSLGYAASVYPAQLFLFITAETGVQSRVTDCMVHGGRSEPEEVSLRTSSVSAVNHLHIHSSPPSELWPDSQHINISSVFSVWALISKPTLGWLHRHKVSVFHCAQYLYFPSYDSSFRTWFNTAVNKS